MKKNIRLSIIRRNVSQKLNFKSDEELKSYLRNALNDDQDLLEKIISELDTAVKRNYLFKSGDIMIAILRDKTLERETANTYTKIKNILYYITLLFILLLTMHALFASDARRRNAANDNSKYLINRNEANKAKYLLKKAKRESTVSATLKQGMTYESLKSGNRIYILEYSENEDKVLILCEEAGDVVLTKSQLKKMLDEKAYRVWTNLDTLSAEDKKIIDEANHKKEYLFDSMTLTVASVSPVEVKLASKTARTTISVSVTEFLEMVKNKVIVSK